MRRLVAIPIKGAVAAGLWTIAALSVAAEVREPGFWYDKVEALRRSGVLDGTQGGSVGESGDRNRNSTKEQKASEKGIAERSPEPAYQNSEVMAEQPADQVVTSKAEQPAAEQHTRLIVISIPDRRLALLEDGEVIKTYPVAVGANGSPSPEGEYTIINHAVNPTYRHDDEEIAPGKDNPLGTRWMGLSLKGYGIHGTNVQRSVGKAVSHGCFRMKKKDVEDLYTNVKVGDKVSIRGERDELTTKLFTPALVPITDNAGGASAATRDRTETEVATTATPAASADEQ